MRLAASTLALALAAGPAAHAARGRPIADSFREGRHIGFGFVGGGPAVTGGLYVEAMPVQYVAITGGWGWFFMVNQTFWGEVKAMPVRGEWTPVFGAGVAGEVVSQASTADDGAPGPRLWRAEEDPLGRAYPFIRLGAMRMHETGVTLQLSLLIAFDGPGHVPLIPWPDVRVGWHF